MPVRRRLQPIHRQHKKTYASPGVKMEFKDRQLARDFNLDTLA